MINFTKAILRHAKAPIKVIITVLIGLSVCACLMGLSNNIETVGNNHPQSGVIEEFKLITESTTTTTQSTSVATTCTTCTTTTTTATTTVGVRMQIPTTVVTETTTSTTEQTTCVSATTIENDEAITDTDTTYMDDQIIEDSTVIEVTDTSADEPITEINEYREYVVYKPSTHYIHMNTCRWFNDECYEISSTNGLECRRCSECNPDMDIISEYVTVQQTPAEPISCKNDSGHIALDYITETEFIYLCNTVGHEYGSDTHGYGGAPVTLYERACVVATVMNRVNDGGWSNGNESTIYNVLTAPYQYNPSYATDYYHSCVTQNCIDAVDYYFAHQSEFPHYTSFWGDGTYNYFR